MAEIALLAIIEGLKRMVDPMSNEEMHLFREAVVVMTGDDPLDRATMTDYIGKEVSAELASEISRLDQRPLTKG